MTKKATFTISKLGYTVIIPHVQNLYLPEKVASCWQYGLKYKSGVFEYFVCESKTKANNGFKKLQKAINKFYSITK